MFYKTERHKRQMLGCFIRPKDRKDRYWDKTEKTDIGMSYKTERQILGCFIRQKDRKDRYWDVL